MWSVGSLERCDFCGREDTVGARHDHGSVCVACVALASDIVMFAEEQLEEDDVPPPPALACTVCNATGVRHLVVSDVEVAGAVARLCDACITGSTNAIAAAKTRILAPGVDDGTVHELDPPSGVTRIRT
ncbi:MAG: hypothetical protein IT379_24370 [Deltaproteobacteria bacterium]|nr:hypothetical protein [Deltaproteobacteria bacterium]